jgi:hypothetical protein
MIKAFVLLSLVGAVVLVWAALLRVPRGDSPTVEGAAEPRGGPPGGSSERPSAPFRARRWPSAPALTANGAGVMLPAAGATPAEPAPRATAHEVSRELDRRLNGEVPDLAWADQAKTALADQVYASGLEGTTVAETRCGATLCRLVLKHDGPFDRNKILPRLAEREGFKAGTYLEPDLSANRTILYVARAGMPLFGAVPASRPRL